MARSSGNRNNRVVIMKLNPVDTPPEEAEEDDLRVLEHQRQLRNRDVSETKDKRIENSRIGVKSMVYGNIIDQSYISLHPIYHFRESYKEEFERMFKTVESLWKEDEENVVLLFYVSLSALLTDRLLIAQQAIQLLQTLSLTNKDISLTNRNVILEYYYAKSLNLELLLNTYLSPNSPEPSSTYHKTRSIHS